MLAAHLEHATHIASDCIMMVESTHPLQDDGGIGLVLQCPGYIGVLAQDAGHGLIDSGNGGMQMSIGLLEEDQGSV